MEYKEVRQLIRKQRSNGVWAGNMLGLAPMKSQGISGVGTVPQYRRLLELGVDPGDRALRLTNKVFFRLLSRDSDPALFFEYKKYAQKDDNLAEWSRDLMREAATASLAQAGLNEDPRVRGSAHRIATEISHFLRSDLAEDPFIKKSGRWILNPEARPPTFFSASLLAFLPRFQRDRAGFLDRLGVYLAQTPTRKKWVVRFGRKIIQPTFYILGDPLQADSAGRPRDLPLALYWIELLARMEMLHTAPTAQRILARLMRDCDDEGVWSPKNLRSLPKGSSRLPDFAFPLESNTRSTAGRRSDVTFRVALIARLLNMDLEYT